LFEYLNETLGWQIGQAPCFNSVENWIKKSGYSVYNNSQLKASAANYSMIIDESMMLGNQRMILNLGIRANKSTPNPLNYTDIEVIGIHVDTNWNASKITEALQADQEKMGKKPDYIISDNESKFGKAIADYDNLHIRDIGHTLAMFLRRAYQNQTDFNAFIKEISRVKAKEAMTDCSYLLPPKQRTQARFMNLSHIIRWASKIIDSYTGFTQKEKQVYRFVVQNKKLVGELQSVLECTDQILSDIKTDGLSYHSIGAAMALIRKRLGNKNERVAEFAGLVMEYLCQEALKLQSSAVIYNASSDMIESVFGCYKFKMAHNALHGITPYVLVLPLITRMKDTHKGLDTDFKANLEGVYMRDLTQWRYEYLTENQAVKRRNKFAA